MVQTTAKTDHIRVTVKFMQLIKSKIMLPPKPSDNTSLLAGKHKRVILKPYRTLKKFVTADKLSVRVTKNYFKDNCFIHSQPNFLILHFCTTFQYWL